MKASLYPCSLPLLFTTQIPFFYLVSSENLICPTNALSDFFNFWKMIFHLAEEPLHNANLMKIVLKLELQDGWEKKKAMKVVSTHSGIDSISMDMKQKKLTVIGVADPITIATKLRKYWPTTDIILVGPAKEPEKPAEKKEEAAKKDEEKEAAVKKEGSHQQKKDEGKKEGDGGEEKKDDVAVEYDPVMEMVRAYKAYNPQMPYHHYVQTMEESPSDCTII